MEAYKTVCPDCGYVRFWVGYKTGIGKSKQQLEEMRREETTCLNCKSINAQTELDHESENGKMFDAQARFLAGVLIGLLGGEGGGNEQN